MAGTGIGAVEGLAANAYASANSLGMPVRAVSPAQGRPRFSLAELAWPTRRLGEEAGRGEDEGGTRARQEASPATTGNALVGPLAGFVAQLIAQDAATTSGSLVSELQTGIRAYARQGLDGAIRSDVEVLSPFPRLASGRALDLTV